MNNWATAQLRKLRKEMEAELKDSRLEDLVEAHIEQMEETNNWSK